MRERIGLCIVIDQLLLGESFACVLKHHYGFEPVEAITDPEQAFGYINSAKPDIVLADASIPDDGALRVIDRVCAELPLIPAIVFGVADSEGAALKYVEAGAHACLLKGAPMQEMVSAIASATHSGATFSSLETYSIFSKLAALSPEPEGLSKGIYSLTLRELEVLRLVSDGLSNKEIAQLLNLSLYTVKNHVHSILQKLHLPNRLDVVRRALF
jgi:DNA-binding NarL/FixJ family response regulator